MVGELESTSNCDENDSASSSRHSLIRSLLHCTLYSQSPEENLLKKGEEKRSLLMEQDLHNNPVLSYFLTLIKRMDLE